MAVEKQLARQDTDFAINPGNNNETSIKVTSEILGLFYDELPSETTRKKVTFFIYKEDFFKSACGIISSLPLLDKHGKPMAFRYEFCNELLSHINTFFGEEKVKSYSAELLYNTDRNSCLQGFENTFNIRKYTVESWTTISFSKKSDGIHMRLIFSKSRDIAQEQIPSVRISLQQIFYGAPGTGKSHTIDGQTNDNNSIRTTFHPDTDYASFVGAYKPMMDTVDEYALDATGKTHQVVYPTGKKSIVYKFEPQVFLKAYVEAWKRYKNKQVGEDDSYYLVIEEINRGNCAQIFGDLFQLLDREDNGYSSYAISPESAITKYLAEDAQSADGTKFSDLEFSDVTKKRGDVEKIIATADDLKAGKRLVLPPNLHIWATMNTSDQSLFPIDSAFKRRWEWQYMPIGKGYDESGTEIKWSIEGATMKYDWWSFLEKINAQIAEATQSEDKKLGFFFCKATDGVISAEKFVGKVIFYLWNDVFKNNGFEGPIFKDVDGTELSFGKFYKSDAKGNAIVQKDKVELFLTNLGVEIVEEDLDEEYEDGEEYEDDRARVSDTNAPYRVTFPDGEIICEGSGWETYVASLQKIGLEKALPFGEKYSRLNKTLPLISDKKIADQGVYKYYEVDGYYILSGTDSQHRLLKRMNKDLNLGLTIE